MNIIGNHGKQVVLILAYLKQKVHVLDDYTDHRL